jgi:hypothetical protein
MKRFVEGADRGQSTLFPECLDDWIDEDINKAPRWERLHGSVIARPTARHGNFQRYLKTFGLMTMVAVSASLAMPMGKAQARGDFSS